MTKSTFENALTLLKKTPIFSDADREDLKIMLRESSSAVSYPKGSTVFSKSNFRPMLCLIIKGEARVSKGSTVISRLYEGDVYGGAFLYNDNHIFENTVTAVTTLKVVIIEKDGVDRLIESDSRTAFNYISYLSERVSFLNGKIEGYTKPSAEEKVLLYLRKNCGENSGECEITVSMTELSSVLQISRASLYRVLDALEGDGRIKRNGKKIYLMS